VSSILRGNYRDIVKKKTDINTAILNDVTVLTQASWVIIDFFTSVVLTISCFIYFAYLSIPLFLITLATVSVGIIIYSFSAKLVGKSFSDAIEYENKFIENFNDILGGFKEIWLMPDKGKFIYDQNIIPVSQASFKSNTTAYVRMLNSQLTGQFLFYTLISLTLLVFSLALKMRSEDVIAFIFTLLFLLGAVSAIMGLLPLLLRAKVSLKHMTTLLHDLQTKEIHPVDQQTELQFGDFQSLTINDLYFSYEPGDHAFAMGPVSLAITRGDIVFIYGGNGSGKTTLINCLLGVYVPAAGKIELNNESVSNEKYPYYKTGFSAIFSDFYLFKEILGKHNRFDHDKWNHYLRLFGLEGKVHLEGMRFSTTSLSTGQRKRLALIISLLEKKPILILDEWAADQDPYFRKKFYTEIVPVLSSEGFTIIAITHDDKYYHCASKLYRMEDGKLINEEIPQRKAQLENML
jgi:putative ATP-binding cassette transporter